MVDQEKVRFSLLTNTAGGGVVSEATASVEAVGGAEDIITVSDEAAGEGDGFTTALDAGEGGERQQTSLASLL